MSENATFDKGVTEFNLGNYKKAMIFFDKVLATNPHHVMSLIKKGNILGKLGRYFDGVIV